MMPIQLDPKSLTKLWNLKSQNPGDLLAPAFYIGGFVLPNDTTIYDTFLRVDGWHKVSDKIFYIECTKLR